MRTLRVWLNLARFCRNNYDSKRYFSPRVLFHMEIHHFLQEKRHPYFHLWRAFMEWNNEPNNPKHRYVSPWWGAKFPGSIIGSVRSGWQFNSRRTCSQCLKYQEDLLLCPGDVLCLHDRIIVPRRCATRFSIASRQVSSRLLGGNYYPDGPVAWDTHWYCQRLQELQFVASQREALSLTGDTSASYWRTECRYLYWRCTLALSWYALIQVSWSVSLNAWRFTHTITIKSPTALHRACWRNHPTPTIKDFEEDKIPAPLRGWGIKGRLLCQNRVAYTLAKVCNPLTDMQGEWRSCACWQSDSRLALKLRWCRPPLCCRGTAAGP